MPPGHARSGARTAVSAWIYGATLVFVQLQPVSQAFAGTDLDVLRQEAEQGDAGAQFNLGSIVYVSGRDDAEAIRWFPSCCRTGHRWREGLPRAHV